MSAFCGFLNLDSAPANPEWLDRQMHLLEPCGPDGRGTYIAGPLALGHLLLSITPESVQESSPGRSRDGRFVIAFDGRLDHREDLGAALAIPPAERGVPDPELILRAYDKWGPDCPAHLEGEFAFALWDGPRQQLFCATDAFAQRDFHYHCDGRRFTFASRIRSVLAVPGVPRELDELALGCDLSLMIRPAGHTLYAGIRRLPGARCLTVRPGGEPQVRPYWQLKMDPVLKLASPREYTEGLRELLERSVRSALRSRHPLAAMLSGGLDSTGVVGLAARELATRSQRLATVSGILAEGNPDAEWSCEESHLIRDTLAMYPNLDPHWARGQAFPVMDLDDGQYTGYDEPDNDPFSYRTRELVTLARQSGARVLLGGLAGDRAASYRGDGYLAQLARTGHWFDLVQQVRRQSTVRGEKPWSVLMSQVFRPLAPAALRRWNDRLRHPELATPPERPIAPAFAARLPLSDCLLARPKSPDVYLDARFTNTELVNAGRFDFGAGWVSRFDPVCEGPQPLLDRRLWEWCYRVPLGEFVRDGIPRSLYRRALHDVLPPAIRQNLRKGWFAPDFGRQLAAGRESMAAFVSAHPTGAPVWNFVHRPAVMGALDRLAHRTTGLKVLRDQLQLCTSLRLAHFIVWFHRHGK